jgi:hypothetical protein
MKKIIAISIIGLIMSSCTTMQSYKNEDKTTDGYRYKYGASKGVKLGTKINAYKRGWSGKFSEQPIGTLTVTRVEEDYSVMSKDNEFNVDGSVGFIVQ